MLGVDPTMNLTFKTWTSNILSAANRSRMSPDELASTYFGSNDA